MSDLLNPIVEKIVTFLEQQHLLSLTTYSSDKPKLWSANCFYVISPLFSELSPTLYFMSEMHTEHIKRLQIEPETAGTIAINTMDVKAIEGVQFLGECKLLTDEEIYQTVLEKYYDRFPISRAHLAPLWELKLSKIKFTSNKERFGEKLYWKAM